MKSLIGADDGDSLGKMCGLSARQRLYGFGICFVLGIAMSIMSTLSFIGGVNLAMFGVFYTLGNLCTIGSSLFLMGPLRQLKAMTKKNRIFATAFFFIMMILTIVVASVVSRPRAHTRALRPALAPTTSQKTIPARGLFLIICIALQAFAWLWYSLTYIPFGQALLRKICCSFVK